MPAGRPTKYSLELDDLLCSRLAAGESMAKVCESKDMPHRSTVFRWFREHPEFRDRYAQAKEESADADQDKIDEIAEKVLDGTYEPQAARVAGDLIKWSASKKRPKKYGDSKTIEVGNKDNKPFETDNSWYIEVVDATDADT